MLNHILGMTKSLFHCLFNVKNTLPFGAHNECYQKTYGNFVMVKTQEFLTYIYQASSSLLGRPADLQKMADFYASRYAGRQSGRQIFDNLTGRKGGR